MLADRGRGGRPRAVAALAAQMGVATAQPLVGRVVILGIAYAFSTDRRAIDLRTVAWGLASRSSSRSSC